MAIRQGVLWDMDGVLVDSGEFHFQAWSEVLPEYGIAFSRESFRAVFGMNNARTLTALFGQPPAPELVAEISDRKERRFRQAIRGRAQPLPGVLDWLERLKSAGWRQAVASSAPPENVDALVDELDLRVTFDALVSALGLPSKPEPALFRCIVVEDAVSGVEAAKRAGMRCIAVTTTNPASALGAADVVVQRLDALPADAFQRLLNGAEV
jgi:HAD superfamily hydrolase (TIGR01509 family)